MYCWKAVFCIDMGRTEADLSDGVTVELVGGLWWGVAEQAETLGGAWSA